MTKWGLVVDISKCNACYCCFTACKDEFWNNDYPPYTAAQPRQGQLWMNLTKTERGKHPHIKVAYMPLPCMQCQDAPCIKAGKNGAVYKRPDGIVVIDPKKAEGQEQVVKACPYRVIYWNEEKKLPQKCTFCVHRLEESQIPRCVQACPTGALTIGDLNDSNSEASQLLESSKAEAFHSDWNIGPSVYYIDLYKITKYFIAGTVVFGDTDECAESVTATLTYDGKSVRTTTNNYGDFEFDGLDAGKYKLNLEFAGYASEILNIDLKKDNYLGEIILAKATEY